MIKPSVARLNLVHIFYLAWRMLKRDWRAYELQLVALGIIVAVMTMSSVGFLTDRIKGAMTNEAQQLLGADLIVNSNIAIDPLWHDQAHRFQLQAADIIEFPSMASSADAERTALVSLKAVSPEYPLKGALTLDNQGLSVGSQGQPDSGSAWVDPSLLAKLNLTLGQSVVIGDHELKLTHLIMNEPDRGGWYAYLAPRIIIGMDDLKQANLLGQGSRANYKLMLAGDTADLVRFKLWLTPLLQSGQRFEDVQNGRPELAQTLKQGQEFFTLLASLTALVAAVAIALTTRRYIRRHMDAVAMLKCLGATHRLIITLFSIELLMLVLFASSVGLILGYALHYLLLGLINDLISVTLPATSLRPAIQGGLIGIWLLVAFALPPLLSLKDVSPSRVFKKGYTGIRASLIWPYLIGLFGFLILLIWLTDDITLGVIIFSVFLGFIVIFAALVYPIFWMLSKIKQSLKPLFALSYVVSSMLRRRVSSMIQVCALGTSIMVILLLVIIRTDFIDAWQHSVPPDAPNRFVINITSSQKDAVHAFLAESGIEPPILYPMVRGRLLALNGRDLRAEDFTETRTKNLLEREFNLSYMDSLPAHNQLVQGEWTLNSSEPQVSMEQGMADLFGIHVGDQLTWRVAGEDFTTQVTSIRSLKWDSMEVNFFAVMNPVTLEDHPQTWVTAFHVPASLESIDYQIQAAFPNVTVFDVSAILGQVQKMLLRVTDTTQFLFAFTLISTLLVLYSALNASKEERLTESALLRALGATSKQLHWIFYTELGLVGLLAGLLASLGASIVAWTLAYFIFHISLSINLWMYGLGMILGLVCAGITGRISLYRVLTQSPMLTLKTVV